MEQKKNNKKQLRMPSKSAKQIAFRKMMLALEATKECNKQNQK